MSKTKRGVLVVIFVFLAAVWIWRYISINAFYNAYAKSEREVYAIGEIVPFGSDYLNKGVSAEGYSLRVDSFEIVDYEAYAERVGCSTNSSFRKPEKLGIVYLTLFNDNSSAEGVMLTDFSLHGIDNYVGMNWELLLSANPVLQGNLGIALSPNTSYTLVMPFELSRPVFSAHTWSSIDEYVFFFHMTSYPTEKDIRVQ